MEDSMRSPERSIVWTEPKNRGKVPVVYYLSRKGQLEHPHFMEVTLSSARGLHLRDVLTRLDFLRGKGMASMYSWSAKRNYKNGFVWHDLSDDDLIHPAHGNEYVLKGSELLHGFPSSQKSQETSASPEIPKPDAGFMPIRRKNAAWSSRSLDLGEYKVYKTDLTAASAVNADAATQTDEKRRRRRAQAKGDEVDRSPVTQQEENPRTELRCDEISPPPSSSSPETLDTPIKTDGSIISAAAAGGSGNCHSGRFRASASAVVMHLISCGSFSLVPPYRTVLQRAGAPSDDRDGREVNGLMGISGLSVEEKEYFSGTLVEMKKEKSDGGDDGVADFSALKRSSSYNAERSLNALEVVEKEVDEFRAKCLPRKPKATGREGSNRTNDERILGSRGSKRESKPTCVREGEHL